MSNAKVIIRTGVKHPSYRNMEQPIGHVCRDVKVKKTKKKMPSNTETQVPVRLPIDVCDWVFSLYPNEPSLAHAIREHLIHEFQQTASTLHG